jgi:LmbE family N-acetylglucosaminyl deacetylase
MAIAAHPGDALFTMGATVAQHIHNGGSGVFLNLSLGEKGHPTIAPKEYGEMQRSATEKAARLLGADAVFLTYPDAEIPATDAASLAVCDVIRAHKPDIVVTHWSGSWHKDHQNTFLIVRDAIFYAALSAMKRTLPAHTGTRRRASFSPDLVQRNNDAQHGDLAVRNAFELAIRAPVEP